MTLDVYSGLFEDDLDAAAERMDEAAAKAALPSVCPENRVIPVSQALTYF
ncbi:hypothetical protein BH18ACT7_BH18ACT7_11110 [soil metagenome]